MGGRVEGPPSQSTLDVASSSSGVHVRRCSDASLYVGHTTDLAEREGAHNSGFGSRYTAARRPVQIVYAEQYESLQESIERERQVKRWTAEKKEALVAGDVGRLRRLSRLERRRR
jgi:putative endonuclease